MKYSEFLQLSEVFESKGTTIFKELKLNEAEDDVTAAPTVSEPTSADIEKTNLAQRLTRWGKMKNILNKNGKKIQNQINVKVLQKYLPQILEAELQTVKQVIELSKQDKKPEEIIKLVRNNIKKTARIQTKQLDIIDTVIDKFLSNAGTELDKKIDASKMKDKNKLDLKNYWLLLKTQIRMNAYTYMQKTISDKSKEAIGDNKIVSQIIENLKNDTSKDETSFWGKLLKKQKNNKSIVDQQREIVKNIEREEKSEETPPQTSALKPGKYILHDAAGSKESVNITEVTDTEIKYKYDSSPETIHTLPIKRANMFKSTETTSTTNKTEGEREPKL